MGKGFAKQKKQAKMLQAQLAQMQTQIQSSEVTGKAGNGLVTLVLTGEGDMKEIRIKPECVDLEDIEGLQDLIKAAYGDAQKQLKSMQMEGMPQMPTGFPGLGAL